MDEDCYAGRCEDSGNGTWIKNGAVTYNKRRTNHERGVGGTYLLDCVRYELRDLIFALWREVGQAVKQIRATHSSPILLVEHAGYSNALADDTKLQDYVRMNEGAKKAFEELQAQGIKDIYYLTREELGLHPALGDRHCGREVSFGDA